MHDPKTNQPYQSWNKTAGNATVAVTAFTIGTKFGGWIGVGFEAYFMGVFKIQDYLDANHPHALDMDANPALWKY